MTTDLTTNNGLLTIGKLFGGLKYSFRWYNDKLYYGYEETSDGIVTRYEMYNYDESSPTDFINIAHLGLDPSHILCIWIIVIKSGGSIDNDADIIYKYPNTKSGMIVTGYKSKNYISVKWNTSDSIIDLTAFDSSDVYDYGILIKGSNAECGLAAFSGKYKLINVST